MLSPESYIQRLKESIYSADKIIQEVSQIQPVSPHSLHELTFDGIPMAKKMLIEDRVKGWYRTTRILIETGSGVLTQLLGLKIHEAQESVTILFSYGLIVDNILNKRLQTNSNTIHVLDNLLTTSGKNFVKYLKG